MAKLTVIGSSNADVTGYCERLPQAGETVLGSELNISPGGKGLNQATAAARAGAETVFITKTGRDSFGEMLRKHLAAEKISGKYVFVSETASTACALIEIDKGSAQNRIIVIPAANSLLSAEDVGAARAEIAESGAVLAQLEVNISAVVKAMELAHEYGKPFILNPAPCIEIPESLISGSDWLVPNETEAEGFTGIRVDSVENAKKAAQALLDRGVKHVVITLGGNGALYADKSGARHIPSLGLKAVETTGAGDTFCGALATAISEGQSIDSALGFAIAAAGISVTRKGAAQSCPTRAEIEKLL